MVRLWKTLIASSLALGVNATQTPTLPPGTLLLNGVPIRYDPLSLATYLAQSNNTGVGSVGSNLRLIDLSDIYPALDSQGRGRCCPPGTVNNGNECVFPESSVCPEGTRLQGNLCVQGPTCPPDLEFDGEHCSDRKGPQCPENTKPEDGKCVSRFPPACTDKKFTLENGRCVSPHPPHCEVGFEYHEDKGKCVSQVNPKCETVAGLNLTYHGGHCVDPEGPLCADGKTKPNLQGRCIGDAPACDEAAGYKLVDGKCHHQQEIDCTSPATLNSDSGRCEAPPNWDCESGSKLEDGKCVKPLCQEGYDYHKKSGKCRKVGEAKCLEDWALVHDEITGNSGCCPKDYEHYDGSCRIYGAKVCPDGSEPKNGFCYGPPEPIKCPHKDMDYNKVTKKCEATMPLVCDKGTIDKAGQICVSKPQQVCTPPAKLEGGNCVAPPTKKCPGGTTLELDACVAKPHCKPPYRRVGTECHMVGDVVCKPGYRPRDGQCRHPGDPVCDPPLFLYMGKCARGGPPICNNDEVWETDKCVSIVLPKCEHPYTIVGEQCVHVDDIPRCTPPLVESEDRRTCYDPTPLKCPEKHVLVGTTCVSDEPPTCKDGMKFDEALGTCVQDDGGNCRGNTVLKNGQCESKDNPTCPEKYTFNEVTRKCVADEKPKCPEKSSLKDGKCILDDAPKCPEGSDIDSKTGECVNKGDPTCSEKLDLVDGRCVDLTPPSCSDTNMTFDRSLNKCTLAAKQECFIMHACPAIGAKALPAPPG